MSDPSLTVQVNNQGGVVAPPGPNGVMLHVGTAQQSPAGQNPNVQQFGTIFACGSPSAITTFFGQGPLVDAMSLSQIAGGLGPNGNTVYGVNIFSGTLGSTTHTGAGLGTVTYSGNPTGPYVPIVKITANGAIGVGKFQWSLDNGANYNGLDTLIPAGGTFVIPNTGITLTFANGGGAFVATDTYSTTITQATGSAAAILQQGTGTGIVSVYAGTLGATTHTGSGTGTVTYSGFSDPSTGVIIAITTTGTLGTAVFKWSINNGTTYTTGVVVPASGIFSIPGTGIVATFVGGAGAFVNLDTYTTTVSPGSLPLDAYNVVVAIIGGGDVGVATFQVSLDGGRTFSSTIQTIADYEGLFGNTGVKVKFANGTGTPNSFVAGDLYTSVCTAPSFGLADLTALYSRLQSLQPGMLAQVKGSWIIGKAQSDTPSHFASLCTTMDTIAQGLEANSAIFRHATITEGPSDTTQNNTDAAIIAAVANVSSDLVCGCVGDIAVTSPVTSTQLTRSCAWMVGPRVTQVRSGEDAGRVKRGGCIAVDAILRDERLTPGLDAARLASARTWNQKPGFFITKARILSAPTSSFNTIDRVIVMGDVIRAAYPVLLDQVNEDVRVVPGRDQNNNPISVIDPRDALNIEGACDAAILSAVGNNISGVVTLIDTTHDLLLSETLYVTFDVTPRGKSSHIIATFQFVNPALQAQV